MHWLVITCIIALLLFNGSFSSAHFFGIPKSVGKYQAVFQSDPQNPLPGEDTFLNFSLLDVNRDNVFNLAVTIEVREGDNTIRTFPEKRYEFSDISQLYIFPREGTYKIVYHVNVAGDNEPVMVEYDLVVGASSGSSRSIGFVIATAVAVGVAALIITKGRAKGRLANNK